MKNGIKYGLLIVWLSACNGKVPLDAPTRNAIDSTATAHIAKARVEIDSMCAVTEQNKMPFWIDSIKKIRLQEIEEKLKTIPK